MLIVGAGGGPTGDPQPAPTALAGALNGLGEGGGRGGQGETTPWARASGASPPPPCAGIAPQARRAGSNTGDNPNPLGGKFLFISVNHAIHVNLLGRHVRQSRRSAISRSLPRPSVS
jgi:hypothetical protein